MPRKGTSELFKISLPTPLPERRTAEAKKTFKDKLEYRGPPPEGLPLPPQPHLADENEEYYQIGLSAVEDSIVSVKVKVDQVIGNPDIGSSSAKKMARKFGREQKYLKSAKAKLACTMTDEARYVPHEEHGLEQPVDQGVANDDLEEAKD